MLQLPACVASHIGQQRRQLDITVQAAAQPMAVLSHLEQMTSAHCTHMRTAVADDMHVVTHSSEVAVLLS